MRKIIALCIVLCVLVGFVWPEDVPPTYGLSVGYKHILEPGLDGMQYSVGILRAGMNGGVRLFFRTNTKTKTTKDALSYDEAVAEGYHYFEAKVNVTSLGGEYLYPVLRIREKKALYAIAGFGVHWTDYVTRFSINGKSVWIEKESESGLNLTGGVLFMNDRVNFSLQYDSKPSGIVASIGMNFDW